MSKLPSDDVLESLCKLRLSVQLKTVLELYDMEIHQKISMPNCRKLTTMVKRSVDQKLRLQNFDARQHTPGKNRKGSIDVADCSPMIEARHPEVAAQVIVQLAGHLEGISCRFASSHPEEFQCVL